MFRRNRSIIFLLILSLIIRVGIMFWASGFREHPDVLRWKDWGRISFLYTFADTYTPEHLSFGTYPNNMPPGTLYVASTMYWVWLQAGKVLALFGISPGSNAWVNVVLPRLILQLPSLMADLGIGYLIGRTAGTLAASLFLFNPVILFNSAVWGQMDSINNFFALLGVLLFVRKKETMGMMAMTVSMMMKFSLVYLLPLFYRQNRGMVVRCIAVGIVIILFVLPISPSPFVWLRDYVVKHATGEMTNVSAFALNVWWVVFRPTVEMGPSDDNTKVVDVSLLNSPLTQTQYGSISLGLVTGVIAVLCMLPIYLWFFNTSTSKKSFMTAYAALAILGFLVLPHMHERYLYPAFVPLAILIGVGVPVLWEFVLLSVLNLVNLIVVWHPFPFPVWVFESIRNTSFQWLIAMLTSVIGVWTVVKLCKKR